MNRFLCLLSDVFYGFTSYHIVLSDVSLIFLVPREYVYSNCNPFSSSLDIAHYVLIIGLDSMTFVFFALCFFIEANALLEEPSVYNYSVEWLFIHGFILKHGIRNHSSDKAKPHNNINWLFVDS